MLSLVGAMMVDNRFKSLVYACDVCKSNDASMLVSFIISVMLVLLDLQFRSCVSCRNLGCSQFTLIAPLCACNGNKITSQVIAILFS
jgi:hypothetical protein